MVIIIVLLFVRVGILCIVLIVIGDEYKLFSNYLISCLIGYFLVVFCFWFKMCFGVKLFKFEIEVNSILEMGYFLFLNFFGNIFVLCCIWLVKWVFMEFDMKVIFGKINLFSLVLVDIFFFFIYISKFVCYNGCALGKF